MLISPMAFAECPLEVEQPTYTYNNSTVAAVKYTRENYKTILKILFADVIEEDYAQFASTYVRATDSYTITFRYSADIKSSELRVGNYLVTVDEKLQVMSAEEFEGSYTIVENPDPEPDPDPDPEPEPDPEVPEELKLQILKVIEEAEYAKKSDVGIVEEDVTALKTSVEAIELTVDSIPTDINNAVEAAKTDIEEAVSQTYATIVALSDIDSRVTAIETNPPQAPELTELEDKVESLITDVDSIKTSVGDVNVVTLDSEVTALSNTLSTNYQTTDVIESTYATKTEALSINDRVDVVENNITTLSSDKANVTDVYTIEGADAAFAVKAIETTIANKIDDAPNDGKLYGRQSEMWTEVITTP